MTCSYVKALVAAVPALLLATGAGLLLLRRCQV